MEQNARTKRKMQGRKGKCKDDTKSDSLDRCEQVERSKRLNRSSIVRGLKDLPKYGVKY